MVTPVGAANTDNTPEIDIEYIATRIITPSNRSVVSGDLPLLNYVLLVASAANSNESIRQKSKSLLNAQVKRFYTDWLKEIKFAAAAEGISLEQKIVELFNSSR